MEKSKKISVFWIAMFVYMGIWLIATGVISSKLWSFCAGYQRDYDSALYNANPDLVMDEALKNFEKENIAKLITYQFDEVSEYEYAENKMNAVTELVSNRKLSYKRADKFSMRKPAYIVYAGDLPIGEVKLKQIAASDSFGFHLCEINEVNLMWEGPKLISTSFEAPLDSEVIVNGKALDETYLIKSEKVDSIISREANKLTGVTFGTDFYTMDGFIQEPEVITKAVEPFIPEESFTKLVMDANEAYIKNMNMLLSFDALQKYFEPGGSAMANVKSAQSGLAWSGKPEKLEIKSAELTQIRKYSDDVIVATTKSEVYRLYRNVEYNEEMNYEWLYVRVGDSWKIRNFSYSN